MTHPRTKNFVLFFLGVLSIVAGFLFIEYIRRSSGMALSAAASAKALNVYHYCRLLLEDRILAISFWCSILLTLGLQYGFPAQPTQKTFSLSFAQDSVWFFYEMMLNALILAFYVEYLTGFYHQHFSNLTVTSLSGSPGWIRFLLSVLLVDFIYWLQHYCHHKVPLLWRFHALHHSQKELNFFTDFRYHGAEYVVRYTFLIVPFLILKLEPPVIVAYVIFSKCYSHFYHGNIRTNLGPFKYVLVTPQSHRVHHSIESQHRDRNFGAIFSIWDFMLGTQYKSFTVYPETGIADTAFPHEQKLGLRSLLLTPLTQLLYPFSQVMRRASTSLLEPAPTRIEAPSLVDEMSNADA
jgi:sterol desaturase/sphingolipid hydroxylase (fatty acid hydroxylase superfamily)